MEDNSLDLIRCAVSSGEFHKAALLWDDYAARLSLEIRKGLVPKSRLDATGDLVEWVRLATLAARAHALQRLDNTRSSVRVATVYGRALAADS